MMFNHWFTIPLQSLSPASDGNDGDSNHEGKMNHINLSGASYDSLCQTSPLKPRVELPNIELFKDLLSNQGDKVDMMKENILFLKKEIEVKNKTIDRLMTFIANVIGANYECVPNSPEQPRKDSSIRSSTPTKHDNITTRKKSNHGDVATHSLSPFENSNWLNNYDFQDVTVTVYPDDDMSALSNYHPTTPSTPSTIESRADEQENTMLTEIDRIFFMEEQLQEVRREKHAEYRSEHPLPIQLKDHFEEYLNGVGADDIYSEIDSDSMISELDHTNNTNIPNNRTFTKENSSDTDPGSNNNNDTEEDIEIGAWEVHNRGFASRQLLKYGYRGKGLGKNEDGIIQPISGKKKTSFEPTDSNAPSSQRAKDEWPKGTVLIAGDSMIGGIDEKRLANGRNRCVKVRKHPGATVQDMGHHLTALLRKKPTYVLIHAGTNDTPDEDKTAEDIFRDIINLKSYVESQVPGVKVTISCPVIRNDERVNKLKVVHLRSLLRTSGVDVVVNGNIGVGLLSLKGVHLNQKGTRCLAGNIIEYLNRL